mgnify:CR=1 FL=1
MKNLIICNLAVIAIFFLPIFSLISSIVYWLLKTDDANHLILPKYGSLYE